MRATSLGVAAFFVAWGAALDKASRRLEVDDGEVPHDFLGSKDLGALGCSILAIPSLGEELFKAKALL
jgi:hypothetical protein